MKNHDQKLFLVYSLNTLLNNSICIHPAKPLYFSTKEKAEQVILKFVDLYPFLYEDSSPNEKVYCIVLEEFELDLPYRYQLSTRVYTPHGLLLSDSIVPDDGPFYGRTVNSIHHEVGEVVELPYGDQLVLGIVIKQPLSFNEVVGSYGFTASDDCYTVIHQQSNEVNYAHAPLVFKPSREVPDVIRKDLLLAFNQLSETER